MSKKGLMVKTVKLDVDRGASAGNNKAVSHACPEKNRRHTHMPATHEPESLHEFGQAR